MSEAVHQAVAVLRAGGLVALPTETVYGLAADAANPQAVARVFALKGRPATHPLIVHIADSAVLEKWAADVPAGARRLAEAFWPGPLTLVLKRQPQVLDAVSGGQDSVGLRVPAHPLALAVLAEFDGGIAAPSANRYGRVSPTTADHVREEFGDAVDFILDGGPCRLGIESTIVSFLGEDPVLLRPGAITPSALAEVLGRPVRMPDGTRAVVRAPGSDATHYAPRTPAQCVESQQLVAAAQAEGPVALLYYSALDETLAEQVIARRMPAQADDYARQLYAALRWADTLGVARLLIELPPADEAWLAVRDRLSRATQRA
jgi:L-threonylcarbamoyladenylate synthase